MSRHVLSWLLSSVRGQRREESGGRGLAWPSVVLFAPRLAPVTRQVAFGGFDPAVHRTNRRITAEVFALYVTFFRIQFL